MPAMLFDVDLSIPATHLDPTFAPEMARGCETFCEAGSEEHINK